MEATEQDIYDQAISENKPETPVETPPEEAPVEEKEGRERDDKGRFVSKAPEPSEPVAETPEPQPEVEQAEKEDHKVPSWRLAEEAQRRRDAESAVQQLREEMRQFQMNMMMQQRQQVQQPQAPQEPIDPFADPQGFAQNIQQSFESRLHQMQLENSLRFARYAHGDSFDKAYEAFIDHAHRTRDQATYNSVMQAADPGEALVRWYQEGERNKRLQGKTLDQYEEELKANLLKDPAFQAQVIEAFKASQQAQPTNTVTNIPPSLSRATATRSADSDIEANDGAGVYAYATAKRK